MDNQEKMEFDALKKQVNDVNNKVADVNSKVTDILHLLKGNDLDKEGSMVIRLKEQEQDIQAVNDRVEKLEKWKDRIVWMIAGMSIPAGYGVVEIITAIFKPK